MDNVSELAIEYKRLKQEIDVLEEKLQPVKQTLVALCLAEPSWRLRTGVFEVSLCEISKEYIKVAEAKKHFGEQLKPFINVTVYKRLNVE